LSTIDELRAAVVEGQAALAVERTQAALDEGIPADALLQDGLMAAMREVGSLFEEGEIFVPEMLVAAHAMRASLETLRPHLVKAEVHATGKVAIGTVEGDLHDIGKNLAAMMLEGAGFEIEDLGTDVYPERFVEAARDGADIVAMSALLTTTMTNMERVVHAISDAGLRDKVRILIGGAPITQAYCDEIGADGYAKTAASAVRVARGLLGLDASDGPAAVVS